MAIQGSIAGRIWFALTADNRAFNQAMNRSKETVSAAERRFRTFQRSIRDLSRSFIGQAGIVTAVYGVGRALTRVVSTFADFEAAMFKVQAISRASGEEFIKLSARARQLGSSTKFTATEAAQGMALLAQAGFSTRENIEAIGATLNLAAAGGLELSEAADIAANTTRGFGLEATETKRAVDVLAATASRANTNVEQLGTAMSYAAPVAAALGQSVEQMSAVIGKLGDAGIKGERAGTNLRGILTALTDPSGDAATTLQRLGVTVYDVNGKMRRLVDIFSDAKAAGFDAADAVAAFQKRNAAAALVIAGTSAEIKGLTGELENAEGESDRMATTMLRGLKGAVTELTSAWEGFEIALNKSEGLLESIVDLLANAVRLGTKFVEMEGAASDWDNANIKTLHRGVATTQLLFGPGPQLPAPKDNLSLVLPEGYSDEALARESRERAEAAAEEARKRIEAIEAETIALKEALQERTQVWQGYWDDLNRMEDRQRPAGVTALAGYVPEVADRTLTGAESVAAASANADRIFGSSSQAAFERITEDVRTLNTSIAQSATRMTALMSVVEEVPERMSPRLRALADAGKATFDGIGDSIKQAILQTDSWGEALERVGKLLAFQALESFVSTRFLGSVFGGGAGRAMGGPIPAGAAAWVGERGPELVRFNQSAYVTPSHMSAGGSTSIGQIVVNVDGAATQDGAALAKQIAGAIRADIDKRQRREQVRRRDG